MYNIHSDHKSSIQINLHLNIESALQYHSIKSFEILIVLRTHTQTFANTVL